MSLSHVGLSRSQPRLPWAGLFSKLRSSGFHWERSAQYPLPGASHARHLANHEEAPTSQPGIERSSGSSTAATIAQGAPAWRRAGMRLLKIAYNLVRGGASVPLHPARIAEARSCCKNPA
jgi:hypothetical protein